ncbi:hypothetical protein ACUOFC_52555, partial [Escherichia sp. TWPC-MK]
MSPRFFRIHLANFAYYGDQYEEIEAVEPEASAEQVDPRDEKIANLEAQL